MATEDPFDELFNLVVQKARKIAEVQKRPYEEVILEILPPEMIPDPDKEPS